MFGVLVVVCGVIGIVFAAGVVGRKHNPHARARASAAVTTVHKGLTSITVTWRRPGGASNPDEYQFGFSCAQSTRKMGPTTPSAIASTCNRIAVKFGVMNGPSASSFRKGLRDGIAEASQAQG